jgi:hypothetical protein
LGSQASRHHKDEFIGAFSEERPKDLIVAHSLPWQERDSEPARLARTLWEAVVRLRQGARPKEREPNQGDGEPESEQ